MQIFKHALEFGFSEQIAIDAPNKFI